VVNIGPHIARIPLQVFELCDQYNLPLFTIPWSVKLVDITRYLSELIIDSERLLFQSALAFKNAIMSPETGDYKTQLIEAGYRLDTEFCAALLSAESIGNMENAVTFIQNFLLLQAEKVVVFYLNSTIVIIYVSSSIKRIKASLCALHPALTHEYPTLAFYMGISGNQQGIDSVASGYKQAECALQVAKIEASPYKFYCETGIYRILFPLSDKQILKEYAYDILGDLLRYDKTHKTNYLRWLKLYIYCDGSVQRIAEEAFCHRNTVNYKLKRIRELFSLDTDSNLQKAHILVALHILDLEHID
jgi:sugar diacid utilization regulator